MNPNSIILFPARLMFCKFLNPSSDSSEKPISKKEACEILNISYNTTRLEKIIEGFLEQETYIKRRREQKRGTAASKEEIKEIVTDYLEGTPISKIANSQYRSIAFVKNIIERVGVPERPTRVEDKKQIAFLPEQCVKESFELGEIVWSALYHLPARSKKSNFIAADHFIGFFDRSTVFYFVPN